MQSTTIIKYKPVRIGFLVREGHREDLVKVAGLNTLLWGGIFNPILPIGTSSADLPDQLLDLFKVEVLCSVADTPEIKAFRDKYPLLKNPAHPADDVLSQDWYAKRNVLAYLDSLNIIVLLWELEYKHKGEDFRSDFALFTWNPEGPLSDLFSISFGFYPTQYGLRDNYADAFLKGLRSRQMAIELGSPVPADLVISQLSATSMQLRITGERLRDDGIYVGNAENFSDLVTFWNLRAAGMMIRFLPVGHETRVSAAVTTFLQHLDKRPSRHPNIEDHIGFFFHSMGSEEVQRIAQGFVTQRERSISGIRDAIWNRLSIVPTQNYFTSEFVPSTIDTSYGRYVVSVGLPKKEFITNEDHARWQSLAVEIDPAGDFGYPGHTLHPPDIKLLQEFYVRQIGIDLFKFRVYHDGIICLIKGSDTSVNVHPIPHLALIQELFEVSGYENSLSQPGLLTKRIVDKMGGLEEARVFKIRGVRKLIGQLTSTDAVTKGHPPT